MPNALRPTSFSYLDSYCVGPTLFLAYINDMSSCLTCRLSLFADDSALIFSGKNAADLASFLSGELSSCKKWLVDKHLSLHVGKNDGEMVQRVTSVKYLCVSLDEVLSFDDFVGKTCNKADGKLTFLHRYSSLLDFDTRRLLCNSLVFSNLTYCVSAWYPGLGIGLRQRLDTIQRKMVRFVNGWKPRSHVGIPEINAVSWLYFPKRVKFFKLCHLFKVKKGLAPSHLSRDFVSTRNIHSHLTGGSDLNYSADSHRFPPNTFHYSVIRDWNQLPDRIKDAGTLVSFKRDLKRHLLS